MALIKCPQCEKNISDKAVSCPSCGYEQSKAIQVEKNFCSECGCELIDEDTSCHSCGCPVLEKPENIQEPMQNIELSNVNLPKTNNKTRNIVIAGIILSILLVVGILVGVSIKKEADYVSNMKLAVTTMITGALTAEKDGNLIHDVWYNTIYEKSDSSTDKYTKPNGHFNSEINDSLHTLFADSTFSSTIDSIKTNQNTVISLMAELTNPPAKYSEAYAALKDYYNVYLSLTNLVENPIGSLQTFSSNFTDADTKVVNCMKAMQIYIK